MGHLMPGHVPSLTAGVAAYESKCALKISFSSRDAADKEPALGLVPRTEYLTWHLPILSPSDPPLSLFLSSFVLSFPLAPANR